MSEQINTMEQCPHLGLVEDSTTSFRFSTDDNCCWRMNRPAAVLADHQTKFCFSCAYSKCPVYQTGRPTNTVKILRGQTSARLLGPISWRPIIVLIEVLAVLLIAGSLYFYPWAFLFSTPTATVRPVPTQTHLPTVPVVPSIPTRNPVILVTTVGPIIATSAPTLTPASTPTLTPAPGLDQPIGPLSLVAHKVAVNESLISIAARFNTTRDVLIQVNSLTDQRPLQVGQVLVVPQGLIDVSQIQKMVAFETVQDTPVSIIVSQLSGDIQVVRQLNALGSNDLVPAGRWLFIPQP